VSDAGSPTEPQERARARAEARTLTAAPDTETERIPPHGEPPGEGRAGDGEKRKPKEPKGPFSFLRELPVLILVAFVLALLIKTFLVQAFYIPSESMLPTLRVGDRVLVNKVVYHVHPPRRGDIIVFAEPNPVNEPDRTWWQSFTHWLTDGLGVTQDPTKDYIKRVIGLPGEEVEVKRGTVLVDGAALHEDYLSDIEDLSDFGPHTVPDDAYFVMGDNRTNSQDSRSLLGDIPADRIIGKAFVVIWPPSNLSWLPRG